MTMTATDSEIRTAIEQMVDALNAGDRTRLRALLAERPDSLHIGSDPNEWMTADEMVESLGGGEALGTKAVLDDVRVHRESEDFAWAAGHAHFEDGSGLSRPFRVTGVLIREGGRWLMVHSHASIGVPNPEMFA